MDSLGPKNVLQYAKRFLASRGRLSALPAHRAGRGRRDAAGSDERLHDVPESGRADEALSRRERQGSQRQPARGESSRAARCHSRRHRVCDHQHPARRAHARHRRARREHGGAMAARRQDRDRRQQHGCLDSIGFDPDITVGVWMGFDDKRHSLGSARRTRPRSHRCPSGWNS